MLRVNAPVSFGSVGLAPVITRYLRRYPQVDIELGLTDRFVDIVDEGWDAVIRLGQLNDSGLAARALASYRLIACASPSYLAEHDVPAKPEDLTSHECLGFTYWSGFPFAEWEFTQADRVHRVGVRSRFRVNDSRMLRTIALDGFGIILQPEVLVKDDIAAGRLVEILPGYAAPSRPIHILFSAARPQSPRLRSFIDAVVEAFAT